MRAATNLLDEDRIIGEQQSGDSLPSQYAQFAYAPPGFQEIKQTINEFASDQQTTPDRRRSGVPGLLFARGAGGLRALHKRNAAAFLCKFPQANFGTLKKPRNETFVLELSIFLNTEVRMDVKLLKICRAYLRHESN